MKTPTKLAVLAAILSFCNSVMAQSGTWTNNAAGNWSDTLNWLNNVPADGAGNTADFTAVNLSAARTVTLDASHTIGKILFSDSAPTYFGWTIAPASTVITLDNGGGSPVISVSNATSVIQAPLAGT